MMTHRSSVTWVGAAVLALLAGSALADDQPQRITTPDKLPDIIPLRDVRIGMKGYGLSVFHGVKVEPFAVEVVSVMHDFAPKRGVIWIRCTDPALEQSGPVSGMSGSPIYLWPDGKQGKLGKGGKLAGAFAYGYNGAKICYAGVQPIELMLEVGQRINENRQAEASHPAGHRAAGFTLASAEIARFLALQRQHDAARTPWRLEAAQQLLNPAPSTNPFDPESASNTAPGDFDVPAPQGEGLVQPMMLPVSVGSARTARLVTPLLRPLGLMPVAGSASSVTGNPPHEIQPAKVNMEPGSVLAIPFAWGDVDFTASGTVTTILPDGRVLGFGHPMFGTGEVAMPMATGFVHFVMPTFFGSFKLSGSCATVGTLVRDEGAAVAGTPGRTFKAAPVTVRINMTGQKPREYSYKVARHRRLMPVLATIVAIESLVAEQMPPEQSTMRLRTSLQFEGDRSLSFDDIIPGASPYAIYQAVGLPANSLLNNPFGEVALTGATVQIDVEEGIREAVIIGGRIHQNRVAPGDDVQVSVRLQRYGGEIETRTISLSVPQAMPEGEYQVVVGGARLLTQARNTFHPHTNVIRSIDDLHEALSEMFQLKSDALYAVMPTPTAGLALGRDELPNLPSSRKAIINSPTSARAIPFREFITARQDLPYVVSGELGFAFQVARDAEEK